jgi:chromate reductase, NAD(P)H dehydrogenase (quinone)
MGAADLRLDLSQPPRPPLRILGLSGSLREASVNTAVIIAARRLAPSGMVVEVQRDLDALPFFNLDLDEARLPRQVTGFRQAISCADGLLICSPEYAHGISGLMKNALDWLVPSLEFPNKPVAVVNASAASNHAHDALLEVLRTMSAKLSPGTTVTLPWTGRKLDAPGLVAEPRTAQVLTGMLAALADLVRCAADDL